MTIRKKTEVGNENVPVLTVEPEAKEPEVVPVKEVKAKKKRKRKKG